MPSQEASHQQGAPWRAPTEEAKNQMPSQEAASHTHEASGEAKAKRRFPADPTPWFKGTDWSQWPREDVVFWWGTLEEIERVKEFNAMQRNKNWKEFRKLTFHHETVPQHRRGLGGPRERRARGGQHTAFHEKKAAGALSQEEIDQYCRLRDKTREWESI